MSSTASRCKRAISVALRFVLLTVSVSLTVSCQTDPVQSAGSTTYTAAIGPIAGGDQRQPQRATWKSGADTGSVDFSSNTYVVKMTLGAAPSDTVKLDLWRAGIQYLTVGFVSDAGKEDLKLTKVVYENTLAVEVFRRILPSTDHGAFIAELAKMLVNNDSAVRNAGFPAKIVATGIDNNAVLDSAMAYLVAKGAPLAALIPNGATWALGLDTLSIHVRIKALIVAGKIPADTSKVFPPYPVRVKAPISIDSVLVAGGAASSVKGVFEAVYQISGKAVRVYRDSQDVSTQFDISTFELLDRPKSLDLSGKLQIGAKSSAAAGTYRLEVMVQDDSLRKAVSSTTFRVASVGDKQGPTVTIVTPAANTVLDNATTSVLVKVSVADSSGVDSVWIDGKAATLVDGNWTYTVAIPVTDLGYVVAVKASDKKGNISTSSVTVGRKGAADPGTATTTILQPKPGAVLEFDSTSVLVRWKVEDPRATTAKVLIGGIAATSEAGSVWSARVNVAATGLPSTIALLAINANNDSTASFVQVTRSVDAKGPTLHITSPIEGVVLGYEVQSVLVHVTATDASGVDSVKIDGKPVAAGATDYSLLVDLAPNQTKTIIAQAWDKLKNVSVDSIHVMRKGPSDTSAPRLKLLWPTASGYEVPLATASVTLKWLVTDLIGIADTGVRIDGKLATRSVDTFSLVVNAPTAGKEQSFRIDVVNAKGIKNTESVTIKRASDLVKPTIVRKDSGRTVEFDVRSALVSWQVTDNFRLAGVTINGQTVTSSTGVYSASLALETGANPAVLIATDSSGNFTKDSVSIVRLYHDSINPVVKAADTLTKTRTVPYATVQATVSWDVTDNDAIQSVTIGGIAVTGVGKRYSRSVNLVTGDNKITIVAADTAKNQATETVTITRLFKDSVAPLITAGAGATNRTVVYDSASTKFNWTATDSVGVTSVTVNGVIVQAGATGYTYNASGLAIGANKFTIVASDVSGNSSNLVLTITRAWKDTIAPVITRQTGTGPRIVTNTTTTATSSWTVTDSMLKSVTGATIVGTSNVYSKTTSLNVGSNVVKIIAIDQQGNSSTDSFVIVRNAASPTHTTINGRYIGTVYDTLISSGSDSIQVSTDGKTWIKSTGIEAINKSGTFKLYAKAWPGENVSSIDLTISQIKSISARASFSWFLMQDGTAWSAGFNGDGQLGTGSTAIETIPTQIMAGVQAIAAGGRHTLLLKADGSVWATGSNYNGEYGIGKTSVGVLTPTSIASGVSSIAAGATNSFFLKSDNFVWSSGTNYAGELAQGRTSSSDSVLTRTLMTGVTALSSGDSHTLFLTADRKVWGVGWNNNGQLALGSKASDSIPENIIQDAIAVAAGAYHSIILYSDRTAYTMGTAAYGAVGNGTNVDQKTLFHITLPTGIVAVAAGRYHSLFLTKDGTLYLSGMLVTSYPRSPGGTSYLTPQPIMHNVSSIAAGDDFSFAVKDDGTLWAFGWNGNGQFGNGTKDPSEAPVQINF